MKISKITLGTAQLGLNYGIANKIGKPDHNTAINILNFAWDNNINSFDTAPVYGNSEQILGTFINSRLKEDKENIIITSKLPKIEVKGNITFENIYNFIKKHIINSLKNLKIERIPIYLLHNAKDIYLKDGIVIKCLNQIKKEGMIEHFGISVYDPKEAETSLLYREIDTIQIPINLFDHRIIKAHLLEKLHKQGYIIFARSIFLQGLFFIDPTKLPKHMNYVKKSLIKLHNISSEFNIEILKLSLLFVRDIPEITSLVIGAEKLEQISENLKILNEKPLKTELKLRILEEFSEIPERIINPSLWNKQNHKF